LEHEEKRKMLDDERRNDYHQFMKEVNNTDVKPGNYNPQIVREKTDAKNM
jgi:hypothetical protein